MTDEEVDRCFKVLVLVEMSSNCTCFVLVDQDLQSTRSSIAQWLEFIGMSSSKSSIVLHTDAERAVGQLVSRVSSNFTFTIRRASPQQHRSVGGAERGVRRLKENLAVLRADLNKGGVDIPFTKDSLQLVLTYLSLVHNHFGKSPSADLSPLEFVSERKLSKPQTALYGMSVVAEAPSSLLKNSPNETRSIEAIYLHGGLGTGPVVQGKIRVGSELVLKRFVARNVKPILPFSWNLELAGDLLMKVDDKHTLPDVTEVPRLTEGETAVGGERSPTPQFVEYPDGAPGDLVREMKESDDSLLVENQERKKRTSGTAFPSSPRPMTMRRQGPLVQPQTVPETVEVLPASEGTTVPPSRLDLQFSPTPNCPACTTGMNVPGIRHSAVCKRRRDEFDAGRSEVPLTESPVVPPIVDMEVEASEAEAVPGMGDVYRSRFKRGSDTSVQELEQEMADERSEMLSEIKPELFWMDSGTPMVTSMFFSLTPHVLSEPITTPEFFDGSLESIQFSSKGGHSSATLTLGGATVLVWAPDEVIDDMSLASLDAALGFEGMKEEVQNLEKCSTGVAMREYEVQAMKGKFPSMRVIGCRWVAALKSSSRVRCRIVAKDLARGTSAKALGYSSPTPSIEALHLLLVLAANRNYHVASIDISHAFMHSPLPSQEKVALRMPLSVSHEDGEPLYLLLKKSLNGLRNASSHWMALLSSTIKSIGLWSDQIEPCVFAGYVMEPNSDQFAGFAMVMAYVDDVLIASSNERTETIVKDTIGGVVPVKSTGKIWPAQDGGGKLVFIGRTISRTPGHATIHLSVSDEYLSSTFSEFGITSGSKAVPDVASHLEKTMTDQLAKQPLSPEGYSRFRRCLGRLLWLSQTRHDLKLWLSIIGVQQAQPMHGTEMAIKSVLRYLFADNNVELALPSNGYEDLFESVGKRTSCFLHTFSDASFAPYRFNQRKGISGGIVMCEGGLIRSLARQQQALSLSSCEAEIYAIQLMSQESVAFSRFVHRMLFSLNEISEPEIVEVLLESDSSSALQLLMSETLPRRSRHVEIRLLWLREQIQSKKISIKHKPGVDNPADLFTKCLHTREFMKHRTTIGFLRVDGPVQDLMSLAPASEKGFVFVEVCCKEGSSLQKCCIDSKIPYAGVVKDVEFRGVQRSLGRFMTGHREEGSWIHMHISTPCSSGSPLKNFSSGETDADREWEPIMTGVLSLLEEECFPDSISFELPKTNSIWNRDVTKRLIERAGLKHSQEVFLCQALYRGKDGKPINKVLRFQTTHLSFAQSLGRRFGVCFCLEHAAFDQVGWSQTGYYNRTLARAIINAAKASKRLNKR